ncbi:DNA polymerase III subunit chi [Pseudomonas sp. v388]|uniref:DNA polymerase III subunit chi n=1 Tax=Pseudomonas sp. v388 TaxID=2479849 RepID=UPI000F777F31|nr:DNA polymerase III subunit chi [Pseudomonas sp. v388]RRV08347.1 DNA polymerase III subunit chi [Pseudomonas sp. v388]
MDTSKKAESAHLLDDLESIRQLLGDDALQPPLLTDTVHREGQIPLLFDVVGNRPASCQHDEHDEAGEIPTLAPEVAPRDHAGSPASNADALLYLDRELRAAAELIMQDVIDDFAPHIETEIKRRLDARLERLLSQYQG